MKSNRREGWIHVFGGILLSLCIVVGGLVFAGCGLQTTGKSEIVLAASRDLSPGEKDPYYSTIILKTWESLVGMDEHGKIIPQLAESWESIDDGREWVFHLKQGVFFHDGVPFNAEAVLENFYRVRHMGYKPSSFYGYSVERIYPKLERVEAENAYTVHLYFKQPEPMLIYRMAGWGSAMFSPNCFDRESGDFKGFAQGTGPFRLVEHRPEQYTVIERFDGYHGEKAKAKRIRIRVLPSLEARYSALKTGEIQGVIDLGGVTPIMAEQLLKNGNFRVSAKPSTISHYLTLNGTRFPFSDERMRRAVNLALNREKITEYYFRNYGTPTMNFLNGTNPFSKEYPLVYDLDEAKRLSAEVLQGERIKIRFLLPQYGVARYPYKVISEFIQAEFRPLGLDVDIVMVDSMTSKKAIRQGDFDISIGTRGLGNLDPTSLLEEFFSSCGSINTANHFGYVNPVVDDAFGRLSKTYDLNERRILYEQIQDELVLHPAVVPLLEDQNIAVCSNLLDGYEAAVYGITLDKVRWVDKKGDET